MVRILTRNLKRRDWLLVVIAVAFIVVQVWMEMTMPGYMSEITTLVQTEGSAMSDIWSAGGKMMLCALASLASSVIVAVIAGDVATRFAATLRAKQFKKVQSFSMEEIGHFSTASLITRSTNDVTQMQMLIVMGLQAFIRAPIMAVWAIVKIWGKAWQWTLTTGIAVVILIGVVAVCLSVAVPLFKKLQYLIDDVNRIARENLTGLEVVRAYNAEEYQEAKFTKANDELTKAYLRANCVMVTISPVMTLVMSGLTLAVYWIGAALINNAALADRVSLLSDMVVFSQYAMMVVMSFMMLVIVFMIAPRAAVAARRINEVIETPNAITDGNVTETPADVPASVEFRNVSFRYPDAEEDVLSDISFRADKGETVAIIGSTGSGKSTVINLIPRFYDVSDGEVLVDGVNVKDYEQRTLRNKIAYISQKAFMFAGTVRSNVEYGDNGKKITEEDVERAIKIAQAEEFVLTREGTYDAEVAQAGANLSGGQKQRLSIARAVARNPEIMIFDDSFSALDYKTDRALRDSLRENCADTIKIIVAQRIGTIRDADRILVIDEGRLVGMGTHSELMENCPVYQEIALSQLSKEEL